MTATAWRSQLLTGRVSHSRLTVRPHAFAYRLFMLRLDLDEIATLARRVRIVGTRWWHPVRVDPADFMGIPRRGDVATRVAALRAAVTEALVEHGITTPVARVELVAHARIAGYVFNPVSFFLARAADDRLAGIVADVHNTFGERHAYVLPADAAASAAGWSDKKVFHVSPFFTLDGSYRFRVRVSADEVDIHIDLLADGRPLFVSHLALHGVPLTQTSVAGALFRFPLMTVRVIGAVHWEALRLWRKGLAYLPRPVNDPARARSATRP